MIPSINRYYINVTKELVTKLNIKKTMISFKTILLKLIHQSYEKNCISHKFKVLI